MLADSGGEGALSGLRKHAIRRSAEIMTIAEWKSRESSNRALAEMAAYAVQKEEKLRLLDETLIEEMDAE